jgi:aryl-phospho-beta-D-glucosidase BglC (GH1 family)
VRTLWRAIATKFKNDERVAAFDIFNEPRWSVGIDAYKLHAQVAVDAIRSTGDSHTIWVEGMLSEERGRLATIAPNGPWIVDRLGKIMYSEHFYDNENGDVYDASVDHTKVLSQLKTFGEWCRKWNVRCSVGEVGWPSGGTDGAQSLTSANQWNALFEKFYDLADYYRMDVTYFAASSVTKTGTLLAYVSTAPGLPSQRGLDKSLSQAKIIEAHKSPPQ